MTSLAVWKLIGSVEVHLCATKASTETPQWIANGDPEIGAWHCGY